MPKTLKNKMVSGNPRPYSTYSVITSGIQRLCWCQTWQWRRCYVFSAVIYREKVFSLPEKGGTHNYMYTMWPKGIDANVKPDGTYRNIWALKGLLCVNNYIKRL